MDARARRFLSERVQDQRVPDAQHGAKELRRRARSGLRRAKRPGSAKAERRLTQMDGAKGDSPSGTGPSGPVSGGGERVKRLDAAVVHEDLVGIGVVTLIFCSLVAGILMLCISDEDLDKD